MKRFAFSLWAVLLAAPAAFALDKQLMPDVLYMEPTVSITQWPEGRKSALVIRFDDSTPDHLEFAVPELEKRGLRGTFYVNLHRSYFVNRVEGWQRAAAQGHSIGWHGLNHIGAWNYEEAEYQVREGVRILREQVYDGKIVPLGGNAGGWTRWGITLEQLHKLYAKYGIFREADVILNGCSATDQLFPQLKAIVDVMIRNGSSQSITFHGVGPKAAYLAVPEPDFTDWLDYVKQASDEYKVWVAPVHHAYLYKKQRDQAEIRHVQVTAEAIAFSLSTGFDSDPSVPMTIEVRLPVSWNGNYELQDPSGQVTVARFVPNVPNPGSNYDRLYLQVPHRDANYRVLRKTL